jgi:hypothetical protein
MTASTPMTSMLTLTVLGMDDRIVLSRACNLDICNTCKSSRLVVPRLYALP